MDRNKSIKAKGGGLLKTTPTRQAKLFVGLLIAVIMVLCLPTGCSDDDGHESSHPGKVVLVVTTDWSGLSEEAPRPESYVLRVSGKTQTRSADDKTTNDSIFYKEGLPVGEKSYITVAPGTYSMLVHNNPEGFVIDGTHAYIGEQQDGTLNTNLGYLYAVGNEIVVPHNADTVICSTHPKQLTRNLSLSMEFTSEALSNVTGTSAELTGIATSINLMTGEVENKEADIIQPEFAAGTNAEGNSALVASMNMLGPVPTEEQQLTLTVNMKDGTDRIFKSSLTEKLKDFHDADSVIYMGDADIDGRVPLQVTGSIQQTRAVGNLWEANDSIGIFMIYPDVGMDYVNVPYSVAVGGISGTFSPVADDKTIYLPQDGTNRNFIAYYPYVDLENLPDYNYLIDLRDQSNQSAIDFMMADMVTGKNVDDAKVTFNFKRKLAKIVLNVKTGQGFSGNHQELAQLATVTLTNQPTKGRCYVPDGGDMAFGADDRGSIELKINKQDPSNCTVEGIVFPSNNSEGMAFIFDIGVHGTYQWELADLGNSGKLEAGKKYEFNITINRNAVPGVRSSIKPWDDDK